MTKVTNIVAIKTETGRIVSAILLVREDRSGKEDQLVATVQVSITTCISHWNDYNEEVIGSAYEMEGEAISADDLLLLTPQFNEQSIEDMRRIMLWNQY